MAATNISVQNPNLAAKIWVTQAMRHERDLSFFYGGNNFIGANIADTDKPITRVNEFTKQNGADTAIIPLVLPLAGTGRAGDDVMEGNEEQLVTDDLQVVFDQMRHAVKSKGRMSEARSILNFRQTARAALADWFAQAKDELTFLTLFGINWGLRLDGSARPANDNAWAKRADAAHVTAPSTGRILFPSTATATNNITSAMTMSYNALTRLKARAVEKRLKPMRHKGKECYVVLMSPRAARDLKNDSDYKTIVANGHTRGPENPLFTGAFAFIDGLYLMEHNKCPVTDAGTKFGASANVDGTWVGVMGAQAIAYASIDGVHEPKMEEEKSDYNNVTGIAYHQIFGLRKIRYNSPYDPDANGAPTKQDFSVMVMPVAAAA